MPNSQSDTPLSTGSLDTLTAYIKQEATSQERSIPPLEKWQPQNCGSMNLVIKANGEWWHEGSKITRPALVDLFATVLWKEEDNGEDKYYLKTPVEKISIDVEDVPFLVTDVNIVNKNGTEVIEFVTSTGDVVNLDADHQLEMCQYNGEERPYIPVRFGMKALLSRPVFMHLIKLGELSQEEDITILTLNSNGRKYQLSVPSN